MHNSDVIAKKIWHIEMTFWEDNCKLKRAKFKTSVIQKSSLPPALLVAISVCILGGESFLFQPFSETKQFNSTCKAQRTYHKK